MIERDLQCALDATKYAYNKMTEEDRELLIQFDDYCFRQLEKEGLDFSLEAAKHIEEEGYLAIPGSKEVVEKWDMFIEEGKKIVKSIYN